MGGESTFSASLPVRRRTETDETEEDMRIEPAGGRESVENENVLFGNAIFPAVTTSEDFLV
jgi:hypothetical protein